MGVRNQQNTKIPTQKMYFGTAIYNGAATSTVTFSDIPSGYTYVIATCQDAGTAILVGFFVLASLLVNEIRSICENLVEMGVDVPKILIKGLEVADKAINKDGEDIDEGE